MKKSLLVLFFSVIIHYGWSQSITGLPVQKKNLLDSMLGSWQGHDMFNGSVLIIQKGNVVYRRSGGYADREKNLPNSDTTHFNLASISKPFTAIAVLQLVQRKKLQLTGAFVQYFPDFPFPAVTITQLLSHTSGLPEAEQFEKTYIAEHPDEVLTNQQVYNDLVRGKPAPLAAAGTKHSYNNLNYVLLALLVERVSKIPFAVYMKKNIFDKAGMNHSYLRLTAAPNTPRYFRPAFYDTAYQNVDAVSNRKIYTNYHLGGTYGNNNIVTTCQDMVLFDNALNSGKLLPAGLLKKMWAPVKLASGEYFNTGGTRTYTLGWNLNPKNDAGQFVAWHDGSLVGLTIMFFKNFTDSTTYIMYENRDDANFFLRWFALSNVIDGVKPTEVPLRKSLVRQAYGPALAGTSPEHAIVLFNALKTDTAWYFDDWELNQLGYDFLQKSDLPNHTSLALEAFRLNTLLAPKSSNNYDSYADGLLQAGLKQEAILMYQKALSLNPKNGEAKTKLQKLQQEKNK